MTVADLQRAHRLQRQQFGIARAGADQGDAALVCSGCGRRTERRNRRRSARGPASAQAALGEALPEGAAVAEAWRHAAFSAGRQRLGRLRPGREAERQDALDPRADRLAEHRRGAVGRDGEHHRRAVDDRAEGHVAQVGLVDDVDRARRRCARGGDEALGFVAVGRDRRRRRAAPCEVRPASTSSSSSRSNVGARGREQLGLPQRAVATSRRRPPCGPSSLWNSGRFGSGAIRAGVASGVASCRASAPAARRRRHAGRIPWRCRFPTTSGRRARARPAGWRGCRARSRSTGSPWRGAR